MISRINILRAVLMVGATGWGATVIGVVLPWDFAIEHLVKFGGSGPIAYDPMMNYWLRMASGAFGIIGLFFLVSAINPHKYRNLIPLLGIASLFEGVVLLGYGLWLELGWFPFIPDLSLAFIPGVGILILNRESTFT